MNYLQSRVTTSYMSSHSYFTRSKTNPTRKMSDDDPHNTDSDDTFSDDESDVSSSDDDDEDYMPDDDDKGSEEEDADDNDETEEEEKQDLPHVHIFPGGQQMFVVIPPPPPSMFEHHDVARGTKRVRGEEYTFTQYLTHDEKSYWRSLPEDQKTEYMSLDRKIKEVHKNIAIPWRFKFLSSDIDVSAKAIIMARLDQFQQMHEGSGEYYKLRNWLNCVSRLPLGTYFPLPVQPSDPFPKIAEFLQTARATLDAKIFGHTEAKNQVMRIFAQWVANPHSKGHCIGIQGPPGIGKTQLVKEGICKALHLPFGFVALGGSSDASFLEGHGFTYEGSTYGKICEILMKTQCMNPIIFFDELDKVSSTSRGEEIIGLLTHLTDSTQNEKFQDKYFAGVDLNLSKSLIIFSYNDESKINHILKDRMITIHVKGYALKDKLTIATDYLLPDILAQYNLNKDDVVFPITTIDTIIHRVPCEDGVRNLKRGIDSIVSWLNMHRYVPTSEGELVSFPVTVTEEHVRKYLHVSDAPGAMREEVARMMYI